MLSRLKVVQLSKLLEIQRRPASEKESGGYQYRTVVQVIDGMVECMLDGCAGTNHITEELLCGILNRAACLGIGTFELRTLQQLLFTRKQEQLWLPGQPWPGVPDLGNVQMPMVPEAMPLERLPRLAATLYPGKEHPRVWTTFELQVVRRTSRTRPYKPYPKDEINPEGF